MFVKTAYLHFLLWFKIQMCSERMLLLTWVLIQTQLISFDTVTSYHKMVMMSNSEYDLQLKQAIHKEGQVWDWKYRFLFMQNFKQFFKEQDVDEKLRQKPTIADCNREIMVTWTSNTKNWYFTSYHKSMILPQAMHLHILHIHLRAQAQDSELTCSDSEWCQALGM